MGKFDIIEKQMCLNCGKELEKALEQKNFVTGEWDGHSFKCKCSPGLILSVG